MRKPLGLRSKLQSDTLRDGISTLLKAAVARGRDC